MLPASPAASVSYVAALMPSEIQLHPVIKAADATIRHIQLNGKLIPKSLIEPLAEQARTEPDAALRGKLLTLKGMLDYKQGAFVNDLKNFNPPLIPPPPEPAPPKKPEPKP